VVDTKDVNLIANIMDDLPLHFAFEPGDTDLFSGVEEAASIAEDWRYGSSALVLVSDGETIPSSGMPRLPASIKDIMVIGVGDPKKGTQLNGRQLRQNIPVLRQMAIRLGGDFHNANKMHVPTDLLKSWSSLSVEDQEEDWGLREWALLSFGLCSSTLAGLPMMLALVMNYRKQVKETK
jgi:Ca-activated chloride channel family protein